MNGERQLETALHKLIGNLFNVYLEAHAAHWNVEGPLFPMLHEFFGEFASDTYGSIDTFAESLRQHDALAPANFAQTMKAASLKEGQATTNAASLLQTLYGKNHLLLDSLKAVSAAAAAVDDQGLQNFTQERLYKHLKWDWQFRVQLKRVK